VGVPSHVVPAYIAAVVLGAGALVLLAWRTYPLRGSDDVVALVVLCGMGILSESVRENDVGRKTTLSFTSILLLSSVALIGPFGAAVVGAVPHLLGVNKDRLQVRVFNAGMTSTFGAVGGFAYLLAGGAIEVADVHGVGPLIMTVGLPLILADIAECLGNALILSGIVRLAQGTPMRGFILGMLGSYGPAYIGYGIIGFLFVILWVPAGVGPASALLILAPLFVARWAYVQYGDEQRAHERTLSALVTAVETKDPYTRGHSERVARLCDLMAGSLALSTQDTEALRFAGMLHDIGKLAHSTRVRLGPDGPSREDLAGLATHADRGAEMVRGIEFLEGSIDAILHHHERMDGRGYPAGMSGQAIPLFARIIAVADAFDFLTTSRLDRDAHTVKEAVDQLHRLAGTQLDPAIVAALERSLTRHVWEPTMLSPSLMASVGQGFDHDDPASSHLGAGLSLAELNVTELNVTELDVTGLHVTKPDVTKRAT